MARRGSTGRSSDWVLQGEASSVDSSPCSSGLLRYSPCAVSYAPERSLLSHYSSGVRFVCTLDRTTTRADESPRMLLLRFTLGMPSGKHAVVRAITRQVEQDLHEYAVPPLCFPSDLRCTWCVASRDLRIVVASSLPSTGRILENGPLRAGRSQFFFLLADSAEFRQPSS